MSQPIDRFVTALPRGDRQVYLSWRLLGIDAPDEPFFVQRRQPQGDWRELNSSAPAITTTDFVDTLPAEADREDARYEYRVIAQSTPSHSVCVNATVPATNLAFSFPLTYPPPPDCYPYRFAIGDLENNGRNGVVVLESHQGRVQVCAYTLAQRK